MKVLITGSTGFLGSRLKTYLQEKGHEVVAPSHSELDITNKEACAWHLQHARPQVVVHCAALANTVYCETHPEESYATNVTGALNLALACGMVEARLVYMSSDQVYNGTKRSGLLDEDVPLAPINAYGQHKLQAEQQVSNVLSDAVALRLTWMYDQPDSVYPHTGGILCVMKQAMEQGKTVCASPKEYRGLTNVWTMARNVERLLHVDVRGTYNFGTPNEQNTFDTYMNLAKRNGFPISIIERDDSRSGRNLSMSVRRIQTAMESFEL